MPGEYAAIGKPPDGLEGHRRDRHRLPDRRDLRQGRRQRARQRAGCSQAAQKRFGGAAGSACGRDFRRADDPEAPTTVNRKRVPLPRRAAEAAPRRRRDARPRQRAQASTRSRATPPRAPVGREDTGLGGLLALPAPRCSNALLVSGARVEVRPPVAVMGPQVAYFMPQILMEEDLHGPGIDARGAAFAGRQPLRAARPRARLRLVRHLGGPGHHRHLRGEALRAGRLRADGPLDALPLPAASACRSRSSTRTNNWTPEPGATTPRPAPTRCTPSAPCTASSTARRRATGKPVAFTSCARPTSTRPTRRSASPT